MAYGRPNSVEREQRWIRFSLWLLLSFFATGFVHQGRRALAQEQPADEVVVDDEKVGGQPAAAETEEGAQAAGGGDGDTAPVLRRSFLQKLWDGLGWIYFPIFLVVSVCLVALIVMNTLMLRRDSLLPDGLINSFDAHLRERRVPEAYELVRNDESFLGRVLAAGMAKLPTGYPQALEAMQEVGEQENMKLEHRSSYISLIATISPMIGLLGTVDGMIRSFGSIREAVGVTPKPSELAAGVEVALMTTLVGLGLAIPAVMAYGLLRNLMARRVLELGTVSEGLMSRFSSIGRRSASAGGTSPGGSVATQPMPASPDRS